MYKNQSVKTEELEMCSDLMFDKIKIDFSKHAECGRENWWALYSKTWKKEKKLEFEYLKNYLRNKAESEKKTKYKKCLNYKITNMSPS